jgi:pimeloyl-ACP methyl ester carboxylesterase
MLAAFAKPLDWLAIRSACRAVRHCQAVPRPVAEAARMLESPDFFKAVGAPRDFKLLPDGRFHFVSPIQSASPTNNIVPGRLIRAAGSDWMERPTVILLHGWNAEYSYWYLFPRLARLAVDAGLNVAMLELPYHAQRKPGRGVTVRNFISGDLIGMLEATRQAVADIRSLIHWLHAQGCRQTGLWGFSLGAWLTGLVTCHEPLNHYSVLTCPVSRMDQVIETLPFCEPIRRSLGSEKLDLRRLNLVSSQPVTAPERILLVEPVHDLFASPEAIEAVWEAWGRTGIWRLQHGHISVLLSPSVNRATLRWIAGACANSSRISAEA